MSGFVLRLARVAAPALLVAAVGISGALSQAAAPAPATGAAGGPLNFTADFSGMASLKTLASQGKGKIGVLLPETTTSARYTAFDEPYLKQARTAVGLPADQFIISNGGGSEQTELTQA